MPVDPDPAAERSPARVGEAAGEAAASSGASREQTAQAVSQASPSLSDADCDRIADRLVARFEARGAFHEPEPSGDAAAADEPGGEQSAGEKQVEGESGEGPPPRKRKFAERFVGRQ